VPSAAPGLAVLPFEPASGAETNAWLILRTPSFVPAELGESLWGAALAGGDNASQTYLQRVVRALSVRNLANIYAAMEPMCMLCLSDADDIVSEEHYERNCLGLTNR